MIVFGFARARRRPNRFPIFDCIWNWEGEAQTEPAFDINIIYETISLGGSPSRTARYAFEVANARARSPVVSVDAI